jgi:hypothetical protein
MVDLMENLIKIGEEQIEKLKKLQTDCVETTAIDGEMIHNNLIISNKIRDWCITIKECKDTKHKNEISAKKAENINKATGELFKLIEVFTPNNKEINSKIPQITVNNSSNHNIDELVKDIAERIGSDCLKLIK